MQYSIRATWVVSALILVATSCGEGVTPLDSPEILILDELAKKNHQKAQEIFDQGADINRILIFDRSGVRHHKTLLMYMVITRCRPCIPWLLEHGADPNIKIPYGDELDVGRTAVDFAMVGLDDPWPLELLLEAKVQPTMETLQAALDYAREEKAAGRDICESCASLLRKKLERRQSL